MTEKTAFSALLRGTSHRVIVVPSPDTRIFKEAVFILRDDYFTDGVSESKLLREAEKCARSFTASAVPARRRVPWGLVICALAAVLGLIFYLLL